MSCAVLGCFQNQRNSKNTFFVLPKDKIIAQAWIKRLNRKDSLPKKVLVCEDHFTATTTALCGILLRMPIFELWTGIRPASGNEIKTKGS